jgi:hypothetical protein
MKKLNVLLTAGMLFIFLIAVSMNFSCRNTGKKTAEHTMEKAIEQSTGEDADVDLENQKVTIKTGDYTAHVEAGAQVWPAGMPAEVPEFKYGKIKGVTTSEQPDVYNWTVVYEEVPADAFKKYNEELKAKGIETVFMDMSGKGGSIGCEHGDLIISVIGGDGTAVVGVSKKKTP